mgnify:CR=1 FL=1
MTELYSDYGGEFDPAFSQEKLSREMLLKVAKAGSDYLRRLDGTWYVTVMKRFGNDAAFDCDVKIWEKFIIYESKSVSEMFGIRGHDVLALMKTMQASPWNWAYDRSYDLIDNNHAVVTCRNCETLLNLEKEGTHRYMQICHVLDRKLFELRAHYFNKAIKVTPLKLPPREAGDAISCQWEFKIEGAK